MFLQLCPENHHIAVVISPLKSLMLNQVEGLRKKGLKCAALSELSDEEKSGIYIYMYTYGEKKLSNHFHVNFVMQK